MFNNKYAYSPQTRPDVPFRRGLFKYIVLQYLLEKPSHGYEIIQALSKRFHGFYVPSPGTVYPRLGILESGGLVTGSEREGRKVYTITDEGKRFLEENPELEREITERLSNWEKPENLEEIQKTMREFGRVGEMLSWEVRKMNAEKLKKVREVMVQTYKQVEGIIQE
jgi:DNA-binding PadR family transcriptional regulator